MKRLPNRTAAILASAILLTALWPLLYGLLSLRFHLPGTPDWCVAFLWLLLPLTPLSEVLGRLPVNARLVIFAIAAWIFYFLLVRCVFIYPSFRGMIRRSAQWYVARSHRES